MGMDVYGLNPTRPEGRYHRNSVWYWTPLWDYCVQVAPELVGPTPEDGYMNDGYSIDSTRAALLGQALQLEVDSGRAEQARRTFLAELADLPRIPCDLCDASGVRTDRVGVEAGMPDRVLEPEVAAVTGRSVGWCNKCQGHGSHLDHAHAYHFDVDNVAAFAQFALASGGFTIR